MRPPSTKPLAEVGKVIVGQDQVIREVTTAIAGGHILPGCSRSRQNAPRQHRRSSPRSQLQPHPVHPGLDAQRHRWPEILDESRQFKFVKGRCSLTSSLPTRSTERLPRRRRPSSRPCRNAPTAAGQRYPCPDPSSSSRPKTPSNRKAPTPSRSPTRPLHNTWVDYPSFDEEVNVVKQTTSDASQT